MAFRAVLPFLLLASCAGAPKGDRAEDYFPLHSPWTGTFKSGDREPQPLVIRHAAPRGKVWLIDVSRFYAGGQFGLLVTDEERGLLLHALYAGGGVAKLDPPQLLMPRALPAGSAWRFQSAARGDREIEVEILGEPRKIEVRMKAGSKEMAYVFGLEAGRGIVRFHGGAGDLKGDWDLAEVRVEKN